MEYYDQDYLNLFKQIKQQDPQLIEQKDYTFNQLRNNVNNFNGQSLNEMPNYSNYNQNFNGYNQNINEVQRNNYSQEYNLNEFNIETRINGQNIQNLNEVKRQSKEDKLNEVMEHLRQERLNAMKKEEESRNLNENVNFKDASVVTLEMFDKARYNSMMNIAKRMNPK